MKIIKPNNLFKAGVLNFRVKTKNGDKRYVNLDNAATTPPFLSVEKGVSDFLTSYGSVHRGAGTKSKVSTDAYEETRQVIKDFVNAPNDSYVMFTGNTTGAMNMAAYFFSFIKGKVAVSAIEHSSSWLPWIKAEGVKALRNKQVSYKNLCLINKQIQKLGREQVLQYDINDDLEFDLKMIEALLKKNNVKALVVTASSNVTGYCPDIKKIGRLAHKYGAMFVVDACQFIQHHPIDMKKMGIDFLAASGHKFYAPFGGGFLIGPKKILDKFLPYEIGGGNLPYITSDGEFLRYQNQQAHDPGTPNAVGAVSMALAMRQIQKIGLENIKRYESALAKKVYNYLKTNPKIKLYVSEKHLSTVVPFNVVGMNPKEVAERLNSEFGIGVRAGSFCTYELLRKLLRIDKKTEREVRAAVLSGDTTLLPGLVRASFSLCNTAEDVGRFIEAIKKITK